MPNLQPRKQFHKIPFNPASWPFFYGWIILFAAAIGTIVSVPGQTFGVSAFTEPLLEALAIDRTGISIAYTAGTLGSAILLTWGGKLYDKLGARVTGILAAIIMAAVLFYLSKVDTISASLVRLFGFANAQGWIALITLSLGFLMLRFWGQGMLLLESTAGYLMVIAGNGIAGGTFGLLMTVTWPRFYGRKHLGAISGFHMSWVVAFSAVGPSFFGIFFAFIHSYKPAVGLCLIVLGGLFYLALRTEDPRKADSH